MESFEFIEQLSAFGVFVSNFGILALVFLVGGLGIIGAISFAVSR